MDQTGFNYEMSNKRTLSFLGERDTRLNVGSRSSTTHSYTSQPTITRDGRLFGKLLLCMQESGGEFGPGVAKIVKDRVEKYKNIIVYSSKSGKMNSQLMLRWVEDILLPAMRKAVQQSSRNGTVEDRSSSASSNDTIVYDLRDVGIMSLEDDGTSSEEYEMDGDDRECSDNIVAEEQPCWDSLISNRCARNAEELANRVCRARPSALFLGDSFAGNLNKEVQLRLRKEKVKFLKIPEHTTDRVQPLDVTFNRQYKKFVKRIMERALHENQAHRVTRREGVKFPQGIINMHSLVWNQFDSPRYEGMLRYAWRNTDPGYTHSELNSRAPPPLVQDIQFNFNQSSRCEQNCTNYASIRCSHCGKLLCLDHFLNRTCFHEESDASRVTTTTVAPGNVVDPDELRKSTK